MKVDNYILEKSLGKGTFGEYFLTSIKEDKSKKFATEKIERNKIEGTEALKYIKNEIITIRGLNHPNIIKFRTIKKTKKNFYVITEYCNGGKLFEALELYKKKYGTPFSEEIIQYLMRQIIDALKYLHEKKIVHRYININNILINYESEKDKEDLNLMKAKVKIADFGFSFSSLIVLFNKHSDILYKVNSSGTKTIELGYDEKSDIWSLGTICYEMLIGKSPFDEKEMNILIDEIIEGKYSIPTKLSTEIISFINNMLKNNSMCRLSSEELSKHPFIVNDIKNFHIIQVKTITNKSSKEGLLIKTFKNKSIWSIFSEEDENKLMNIGKIKCDNFRNTMKRYTSQGKIKAKNMNLYNFLMKRENENNIERNSSPHYNYGPAPSAVINWKYE